MFVPKEHIKSFDDLFKQIKLGVDPGSMSGQRMNKQLKINQIINYLEMIDGTVRKLSSSRNVVFLDSGSGSCYLSFLVAYYYQKICGRQIEIHCVDISKRLLDEASASAKALKLSSMHFHVMDVEKFKIHKRIDIAYSLHACDIATDKAIYVACKHDARAIYSVTCCQHSLAKRFKAKRISGLSQHKQVKEKLFYMVIDSMRSMLLEQKGYKSDVIEFTSSRNTGKNLMIRAVKGSSKIRQRSAEIYLDMKNQYGFEPYLENLLTGKQIGIPSKQTVECS